MVSESYRNAVRLIAGTVSDWRRIFHTNTVDLITGDTYRIKAMKEIIGENKHFIYWGGMTHDISVSKNYTANPGLSFFVARYKSKITIEIDAPDGVEYYLHDPWLVDENDELFGAGYLVSHNELCPNNICEVFPNRGFSGSTWVYPYYQLVASRLFPTIGDLATSTSGNIYRLYELDENEAIITPESIFNYSSTDLILGEIVNNNFMVQANIGLQDNAINGLSLQYISQNAIQDYGFEIYENELLLIPEYSYIEFEEDNVLIVYGELIISMGTEFKYFGPLGIDQGTGIEVWGSLRVGKKGSPIMTNLVGSGQFQGDYGWRGIFSVRNAQVSLYSTIISHATLGLVHTGYYEHEYENPWGVGQIEVIGCRFENNFGLALNILSNFDDQLPQTELYVADSYFTRSVNVACTNNIVEFDNNQFALTRFSLTDVRNQILITNNAFGGCSIDISGEVSGIIENNVINYDPIITYETSFFGSTIQTAITNLEAEIGLDIEVPENPYNPSRDIEDIRVVNNTIYGYLTLEMFVNETINNKLIFRNNYITNNNLWPYDVALYVASACLTCEDQSYPAMQLDYGYNCVNVDFPTDFYRYYNWFTMNPEHADLPNGVGDFSEYDDFLITDGHVVLDWESPLIDAGDPDTDQDGMLWFQDGEEDQDPDVTRKDVGSSYFHIVHGDVDNNGSLEVYDLIIISDLILYPGSGLNSEMAAADYNIDSVVNVLDQVAIINCILNDDCLWVEKGMIAEGYGAISFRNMTELSRSVGQDWEVVLESDEEISGMQLVFEIDETEESIVNIEKSCISDPFMLDYSVNDGLVTVLLYPVTGYSIPPGMQPVMHPGSTSLSL